MEKEMREEKIRGNEKNEMKNNECIGNINADMKSGEGGEGEISSLASDETRNKMQRTNASFDVDASLTTDDITYAFIDNTNDKLKENILDNGRIFSARVVK